MVKGLIEATSSKTQLRLSQL